MAALKKKIHEQRKKEGKKPIDFNGESSRLARSLQRSMGRALENAGIKSIGQFNDLMGKALGYDEEKEQEGDVATESAVLGGGEIGGGAARAFEEKSDSFNFLEGLNGEGEEGGDLGGEEGRYTTSGDEDIHSSQENIFKLITFRYQESAYPVLLDKKR